MSLRADPPEEGVRCRSFHEGVLTDHASSNWSHAGRRLSLALVGKFDAPEFVPVRKRIELDSDHLKVLEFTDPSDLLQRITSRSGLELVLVAQERPGQWHAGWLDRLRAASPLTRTVAVLGNWCKGETRTGKPLGADVRLFWNEFPRWWGRQIERRMSGKTTDWSFYQPLLQRENLRRSGGVPEASRGLVLIAAQSRDTAEATGIACRAGGWSSVWVRPPQHVPLVLSATAIVLDAAYLETGELAALERVRRIYGPLPVIALCDYPTAQQEIVGRTQDIRSILGKPYQLDDLLAALHEIDQQATQRVIP